MEKPLIILGIDPGTLIMGYSIIEVFKGDIQVKELEVLKLSGKQDNYIRLQRIHEKVTEVITKYCPNEFAIEAPFYGKNVQSMLKLGRAQGVAIAAAMSRDVPITEYSPKKVKQSITGNGNADKDQVWQMLQRITTLPDKPKYFDASDALAVAICHYYGRNKVVKDSSPAKKRKAGNDWSQFIQSNQHRIKI